MNCFFYFFIKKRTKEVVIFHLDLTRYNNERNKKCNKLIFTSIIKVVGIRESDKDIGLWATLEDAKEPEDNQVLIREY